MYFSYSSCLFLILYFMLKNYVAMPNMLSVSIYLRMRVSYFRGFQNMYFHGMCILGTFPTLYPNPVNATLVFHA